MTKAPRAPFVALCRVLRRRFPGLEDPEDLIRRGLVLVDGATQSNPSTMVRVDASIRVLRVRPLRGTRKLAGALVALQVDVEGADALDVGAAAGGFTQALLDAGARRVYAVDAGIGQLRGALRRDSRVVNLERTNLSQLASVPIEKPVGIVTMDLSYLGVAGALPQLPDEMLGPGAHLVALVKPTFELRSAAMAAQPEHLAAAIAIIRAALAPNGWRLVRVVPSTFKGSRGAVEAFLHATRR